MSPSKSSPEEGAWLLPASLAFMTRGAAFHLVEWGARDGLSLIADYLERPGLRSPEGLILPGPEEYRRSPFPVLSRTGLGPEACAPPEEPALWRQLSREPSGPRLERLSWERAEEVLRSRWTPGEAEGLLVFGLGSPPPAALRDILGPWGDLGFWVEWRRPDLAAHRVVDGVLRSAVLACAAEGFLTVLPGWNFLQPTLPVKAPRHTIEEPPRGGKI